MSKSNLGQFGYSSTLIHDTQNPSFVKKEQYLMISKIICYYTDTAIIGIFPFYSIKSINNEILKTSYYNQFKEDLEKTIKPYCNTHNIQIKFEEINFQENTQIIKIHGIYDENKQQILSLRIETNNNKIYPFGNQSLFNVKRDRLTISKTNNFISGFRTDYIKDIDKIPYLSFIRAHFATEDDFEKYYYTEKKGLNYNLSIFKKINNIISIPFLLLYNLNQYLLKIFDFILKYFIICNLVILPLLAYYYSSQNIYNGIIKINKYNSNLIENKNLEGLFNNITIYTDNNGLSHIKGNNEIEVYFGLGFEHAKNRLWQIDMLRRSSEGRLSEIFGKKSIKLDKLVRGLGLYHKAKEDAKYVNKNSEFINIIRAYIDGINFYAKNFVLPIEYKLFGVKFEEWKLEDSIAILNFNSFGLGHDWNMEVWYKTMEELMGKEFADNVISFRDEGYPFWNETIVNDDELAELGLHKFRKTVDVRKENEQIFKDVRILDDEEKKKNEKDEKKEGNKNKKEDENELKKNIKNEDENKNKKDEENKLKKNDIKKEKEKQTENKIDKENKNREYKKEKEIENKVEEKDKKDVVKEDNKKEEDKTKKEDKKEEKKEDKKEDKKEEKKEDKKEEKKENKKEDKKENKKEKKKEDKNEDKKVEKKEEKKEDKKEYKKEEKKEDKKEENKKKNTKEEVKTKNNENQKKVEEKNSNNNKQENKKEENINKEEKNTEQQKNKKKGKRRRKKNKSNLISTQNEGASNCWVLSGNLTTSGKPLLSNDPHLPTSMPSLFFLAKIYLPNNTLTGATLPGCPVFASGSNNYMTWGLTTENSDNTDICHEKIEDNNYIYDNKKFPLKIIKDVIYVRNGDSIPIDIKYTRNGPLIPNNLIPKEYVNLNFDFQDSLNISFRSAFYQFPFENFDFYIKFNLYSKNYQDILPYIDKAVAPNYNAHYASINGDIGWVPLGKIAVKNYYNRFCRGYESKDDILKYIPRSEMLYLKNPSKGFIVTANNKPASFNYTYELRGHHNHVRAHRINQMINEYISKNKTIGVEETKKMINDVKECLAEYILPKILKILERNHIKNLNKDLFYNMFKRWNYTMNKESEVATLYAVFERKLAHDLLSKKLDDLHSYGIMSYLHYFNFISGIIDKIYNNERYDLAQCSSVTGDSNCEKYIIYEFKQLNNTIKPFLDNNGKIKKWGKLNFNDYPHLPFDHIFLLRNLFSKKVYTGGNRNTVKIVRGPFNHAKGDFVGTQSARIKFICDTNEINSPYISIPGGNGGSILNRYYNNLMDDFENINLIKFNNVDFKNISNQNKLILIKENL